MKICGTVAFAVAFLATCSLAALRRADDVQTPAPGERDVCGYPCSTSMDCADASGDCPFCLEGQCVDRRCGQFCNSNFNCDFIGCSECIDSRCMPATPAPIPPPPPPLPVGWGALWCLSYNTCSSWGAYAHATSEVEANAIARSLCGDGTNCAMQKNWSAGPLTVYTCLGLATMPNGNYGWTVGTTAEGVAQDALQSCGGTVANCSVAFAQCASAPPRGTRFGALACGSTGDGCTAAWAFSGSANQTGFTNQTAAMNEAIVSCEANNLFGCHLVELYTECSAVFANTDSRWFAAKGDSVADAEANAYAKCSEFSSSECRPIASNCLNS